VDPIPDWPKAAPAKQTKTNAHNAIFIELASEPEKLRMSVREIFVPAAHFDYTLIYASPIPNVVRAISRLCEENAG
jgi:hypothetical protein